MRRCWVLIAALLCSPFLSPFVAAGQMFSVESGVPEFEEERAFGSFNSERDLLPSDTRSFPWLLRLTAAQRDSFSDLYEAYRAQRVDAGQRFQKYMESASKEAMLQPQNQELMQQLHATWEKFHKYQGELRARLLDDLRLILTPEQDARWTFVERALLRATAIRGAADTESPGQRADVTRLAIGAMGDAEPPVELLDAIDRYELDAAEAVAEFHRWRAEWREMERQAFDAGQRRPVDEDPDAERRFEDRLRLRAIADVNVAHAERVAAVMPPEAAARFLDSFYRSALAARYGVRFGYLDFDSAARQAKEAVSGTPHAAAVDAAIAQHKAEMFDARVRQLARVREEEKRLIDNRDTQGLSENAGQNPMWTASYELMQLETQGIGSLRAVIPEDILATLPPPLGKPEIVPPVFE